MCADGCRQENERRQAVCFPQRCPPPTAFTADVPDSAVPSREGTREQRGCKGGPWHRGSQPGPRLSRKLLSSQLAGWTGMAPRERSPSLQSQNECPFLTTKCTAGLRAGHLLRASGCRMGSDPIWTHLWAALESAASMAPKAAAPCQGLSWVPSASKHRVMSLKK